MSNRVDTSSYVDVCRSRLEKAKCFREVYELVKDTVKHSLGIHRSGILLFLQDLPLQFGAYHQVGTNNIIMNRSLLSIVQSAIKSPRIVNAFIYSILLHEYLHALGYLKESEVRPLVYKISRESFGEDDETARIAGAGPWLLLKDIPVKYDDSIEASSIIEIVKDFEKTVSYIV